MPYTIGDMGTLNGVGTVPGITAGQLLSGGGLPRLVSGTQLRSVTPTDGSRSIITDRNGNSVDVRANVAVAVYQTDSLSINSLGANGRLVVDFGEIVEILDMSGTAVAVGAITIIDPNGVPHDLAAIAQIRANGIRVAQPPLPPGRYTFLVPTEVTSKTIYIKHIGARNLA